MSIEGRTDDVESMRRLHRRASQAHDVAPDPSIRTTVLAAAARAVASRPHGIGARFQTPARARRWPLSAAAAVLVSVMTGLVVTQTMQDDPRRMSDGVTATSGSAPPAPTSSSPLAPPAAVVSRADEAAPSRAGSDATTRFVPSPPTPAAKPKAAPLREARTRSAPEPSASQSAVPSDPATAPPADRAAVPLAAPAPPAAAVPVAPAPPASPAPPPARVAPSPAREDRERLSNEAAMSRDAKVSDDVDRRVTPSAMPASPLLRARSEPQPATPQAWLARIAALRAAGRDAEADREVDALHARYPSFAIPDDARSPATR